MASSSCVARSGPPRGRWRRRPFAPAPPPPPPLPSLRDDAQLTVSDFAFLVATGNGAVRCAGGGPAAWHLDTRHEPLGRLPMTFFARAANAPPGLLRRGSRPTPLVDAALVDAPQLNRASFAPHARLRLVFVRKQLEAPALPHNFYPEAADATMDDGEGGRVSSERLYWAVVSTDSCEAVHCGALLALRNLMHARRTLVHDDARRSPLVEFGMVNALRVDPFVRHIMVPVEGCRVDEGGGGGGGGGTCDGGGGGGGSGGTARARVLFSEAPREGAHGGAMHQLVWARAADGRQIVFDFTGAQYGVDERLPSTGSPFWQAEVEGGADGGGGPAVRSRGFELTGQILKFSEATLPTEALGNEMHAYIGSWIRDSALGVLDHRRRSAHTRGVILD